MSIVFSDDADVRFEICKTCPEYRPAIYQCSQCGCIMPLKVHFKYAKCPLGKWQWEVSNEQ